MATKVRYVSSSDGINVRKSPAGAYHTSLPLGNLMYEKSTDYVEAELNGVTYTWVNVHYYHENGTEGDGWVTKENTFVVPSGTPIKPNVISSSDYIKQQKSLVNARYIHKYLKAYGWSDNALFAMLGNMESESTINPGKWQSLNNTSLGYGLVQWTGAQEKLIDWAEENNLDYTDIDTQLKRLLYEVENENDPAIMQWLGSRHTPQMSFSQFTTSTKSISALAEYFVRCYESPKIFLEGSSEDISAKIAKRQKQAEKWATLIGFLS